MLFTFLKYRETIFSGIEVSIGSGVIVYNMKEGLAQGGLKTSFSNILLLLQHMLSCTLESRSI